MLLWVRPTTTRPLICSRPTTNHYNATIMNRNGRLCCTRESSLDSDRSGVAPGAVLLSLPQEEASDRTLHYLPGLPLWSTHACAKDRYFSVSTIVIG